MKLPSLKPWSRVHVQMSNIGAFQQEYNLVGDTGYLNLRREGDTSFSFSLSGSDWVWDLAFNPQIPLELSVNMGAGSVDLDLTRLAGNGCERPDGGGQNRGGLAGPGWPAYREHPGSGWRNDRLRPIPIRCPPGCQYRPGSHQRPGWVYPGRRCIYLWTAPVRARHDRFGVERRPGDWKDLHSHSLRICRQRKILHKRVSPGPVCDWAGEALKISDKKALI
jgi:hypothetical protein